MSRSKSPPVADPLVSVVIPTHNRAAVLGRAIDSVLAQTFRDLDVIVVDDGSTDATPAVLAEIADARVRIVSLAKRRGGSAARNAGIRSSRAEWIAFLDSDDEWLPTYVERQLEKLGSATAGFGAAYSSCHQIASDGSSTIAPAYGLDEGDVFDSLLRNRRPVTASACIVRRSVLIEVGGFDEELASAQEFDLLLRVAQGSHRFASASETLVIKHDEASDRIKADPIARMRGFRRIDTRWGTLMRERAGSAAYARWRRRRLKRIRRGHEAVLASLAESRDRRAAFRYALRLFRVQPWALNLQLRALAVAFFGSYAYAGLAQWRKSNIP